LRVARVSGDLARINVALVADVFRHVGRLWLS
jgi:hypothetical protein